MSSPFISTFILFFSLLNPFLMSIYMIGLIRHTETRVFNKALIQGSLIAYVVFLIYAELSGDFPLGDSRQPTYKSLRPFDLVS
ncbi:hypothetical protein ACLD04_02770, partial [Acinetobacter baumannii]